MGKKKRERHSAKGKGGSGADRITRPLSAPMPEDLIRALVEKEGYPAPEEREAILRRRGEIMREMIQDMLVNSGVNQQARGRQFLEKYGARDTAAVLNAMQRSFARPEPFAEDAWLYRQYRLAYARFGSGRQFLSYKDYEEGTAEWGMITARREMLPIQLPPSRRERELQDLLLTPPALWEDLLPHSPPPRPSEFSAPPTQEYQGPERDLLDWGPDLDLKRIQRVARDSARWTPALPDVARMTLDEGLLAGWPGEPSAWAPYHALHLLGALRAGDYAARLVALARRENDWLSDRLPEVWAQIGESVVPALWKIIDNHDDTPEPRALAASGLQKLSQTKPVLRAVVVQGFSDRLSAPGPANAILNAYLILILKNMSAEEAGPAIRAAFKRGAVDRRIMELEDVPFA